MAGGTELSQLRCPAIERHRDLTTAGGDDHRLSTVQNAAAIAVLKEGVVAEVGTHVELLAKGGLYADLWAKHAREDGEGVKEAPAEVVKFA